MTCHVCGARLPADADTCPTCGAEVTVTGDGPSRPPPGGAPASEHPGSSAHHTGVSREERNWAMGAHLSAFVAFVGGAMFLSFLGPLVVWLVRRDTDAFTARHAREALNFNLTFLLVTVVGGAVGAVLALVTLGLGLLVLAPLFLAVFAAWVVLTIVATVAAADGRDYRYPFTMRFIS